MNETLTDKAVGKPLDRVDGRLKVTGGARYSGDMPVPDVVYAVLIMSTAAPGRITGIDASASEALPGVLRVITPANALRLQPPKSPGGAAGPGRRARCAYLGQRRTAGGARRTCR